MYLYIYIYWSIFAGFTTWKIQCKHFLGQDNKHDHYGKLEDIYLLVPAIQLAYMPTRFLDCLSYMSGCCLIFSGSTT